jgi:hypothetical protein
MNKNNNLKLSLEADKISSYNNKPNNICCNSHKNWYPKKIIDNTINLSQSNFRDGKNNLNLSENNYFEKKIRNKNNKNKVIIIGKSNSLRNIKYNANKIITDKSISILNKNSTVFETSPKKRKMSLSNEKMYPFDTNIFNNNYNNYFKINYPSSALTTSRKKRDDNYYSYLDYNDINKEKYLDYDSSHSDNMNNNILELLEYIENYFYSSTQFQNIIINGIKFPDKISNILFKQKKSLMELNKSLNIYNNILIKNNLKQKLLTIINLNENINKKLMINYNNKKNYICFRKNNNNNIETIKGKCKLDYNKIIEKLKNENNNLSIINQKIANQNKILNQKFNDFVNDIENQLKDFPYKSKVNKDNLQNKIISQINSLIILTKELNNENKNLEKENKGYKLEIENIKKDNKNLKKEIHDNSKETTNKIITIKNTNDNEIKNQKKIFYDKIHKLNDLLEESNRIIRTYEKEVTYLKNKNLKLENNLKLLSQSHKELEKIINTSTSGLKSEIDIKDQKYNDLLKELQLKDVHIKSLENLFDKQNKPEAGKIFTKINAIPLNLNDDDDNYIINNEDGLNTTFNKNKNNNNIYSDNAFNQGGDNFGRDEVNEMKLNKLINNFEIKNKINNFNKDNLNLNQNQNKNFMELKDLIKQSGDDLNDSNVEGQYYILDENNQ